MNTTICSSICRWWTHFSRRVRRTTRKCHFRYFWDKGFSCIKLMSSSMRSSSSDSISVTSSEDAGSLRDFTVGVNQVAAPSSKVCLTLLLWTWRNPGLSFLRSRARNCKGWHCNFLPSLISPQKLLLSEGMLLLNMLVSEDFRLEGCVVTEQSSSNTPWSPWWIKSCCSLGTGTGPLSFGPDCSCWPPSP